MDSASTEDQSSDLHSDRPLRLTVLQQLVDRFDRRPQWSVEDRDALMADLFPDGLRLRKYVWQFTSLSVLSTMLASFGLIANSVATLIAGMLIDPMMTPVLGTAVGLAHGQPRRVIRCLALLAGGTVLSIATGWLIAAASPAFVSVNDLAPELLLRTSPSLLDLGVAVAAGISAGYVLTHRDANSVLPGVAVAVALVPPLAAVGVLLNVGATAEAGGAFLLFVTNLDAIIISVLAMLVISGFLPRELRRGSRTRVRAGFAFTAVALVVLAIPMARQTFTVIEERNFRRTVNESVEAWDPSGTSREVTSALDNGRGEVTVVVSTERPVPASRLACIIEERTGRAVDVRVEYRRHTNDAASTE